MGDGQILGNATYLGSNITDTVHFPATPVSSGNIGQRPASWSVPRSGTTGVFSISSSPSNTYWHPVVHSTSGASLLHAPSANPKLFHFFSSPTAQPITLFGAANQNDLSSLANAKISPSGTFVTGQRLPVSPSSYQPVVWKMPTAATSTFKPIRLIPPAGATISDWPAVYVNDHGYVVANGTVSGQSRPILWKVSADGTTATASILPPISGSRWAEATGISNQDPPLICGNSSANSNQQRAVVWTAAGAFTNLGTLPGGNSSSASIISRGGSVAGISNVLVGNALKQQPFLATYVAASSSWKLQAQGESTTNAPSITSINDSGEILGSTYESTPIYRQIPTLWLHGRAHPIDTCLTATAGATLENVTQLSPHGTLLATVKKQGANLTVLLTPDRDTDNDGPPDAYENQHGFNAFVKNQPNTDSNSDNLTDLEELRNNTDPRNPDTDDDGMKDGFEVSWGLLPLDPTDAPLDPDNDRVTNLLESQIGTTPTGIYKVETRIASSSLGGLCVNSDNGQIVFDANSYWNSGTDENGWTWEESYQPLYALPPVDAPSANTPIQLPVSYYMRFYNSDWSESTGSGQNVSYYPDQSSNRFYAALSRYSYDSVQGIWEEWFYLIPDIAGPPDESGWIEWTTVENNLRNADLYGGTAPLGSDDFLQKYPDAVSPSGTRRIHHSNNSWEYFALNERGELVEKLTNGGWQMINDQGIAVRMDSQYVPPANGLTAYYAPQLVLSTGETIPAPHESGISPNYTLLRFSNDGKVLLSKSAQNEQFATYHHYYLFDTATGFLDRVRQPDP